MFIRRSRDLQGGVIENATVKDLKVRPLNDEERDEQLEQLRRAWLLKLLLRRRKR
jgi:hypothetical protein